MDESKLMSRSLYVFLGRGLTLQHLRYNSECNVYEELEPIDRNLRYDFNYQQIVHFPSPKTILPVYNSCLTEIHIRFELA